VKLRCLSHVLAVLAIFGSSISYAVAQMPAATQGGNAAQQQPPTAPNTSTAPSSPAPTTPGATTQAPPAGQQNLSHPPFPTMPPPPPAEAPINVNTPGIEANVPKVINVPGVAATVNGKPITFDYLIKKFIAAGAPQFLDEIVNEQLIRQQAAKEHIVVTPAETAAKMQQAKLVILPQYPGMSWAQFLGLQGRSESYIRDNIYDGLLAVKLVEKQMTGTSLVGKVHLYHILRLTQAIPNGPVPATDAEAKAEIEQILSDIQSHKETFQEAAMKESQDSSASKGGDLGWVGPDQNLDKSFAAAAFSLKEGQISEPVRSQYGWHLIYAEKYGIHADAQDIAQYQTSLEDRARQQIQAYLKNLRNSAKIVNFVLPSPPLPGPPKPMGPMIMQRPPMPPPHTTP
jgi:foldase protein PrsA